MELDNENDFERDLNLDFTSYARHFVANEEHYDDGFFFYQVQTGLEGAPRADEIFEDLEILADEGFLERETTGSSSKMPDTRYFLATEEERTAVETYAKDTRDWVESYTESIRDVIPTNLRH